MSPVRPVRAEDLERVLDLWEALMANGRSADPRWNPAPGARGVIAAWAHDLWLRDRPFARAWVAEVDEEVVGFVAGMPRAHLPVLVAEPVARITDLFVSPSHRRAGLGRALVSAFAHAASQAGYPTLEAGTLIRDRRAVEFWRAVGLQELHVVLTR